MSRQVAALPARLWRTLRRLSPRASSIAKRPQSRLHLEDYPRTREAEKLRRSSVADTLAKARGNMASDCPPDPPPGGHCCSRYRRRLHLHFFSHLAGLRWTKCRQLANTSLRISGYSHSHGQQLASLGLYGSYARFMVVQHLSRQICSFTRATVAGDSESPSSRRSH